MRHLIHTLHTQAPTLTKTVSYYAMHIVVASAVAWLVTGDWRTVLAMSLLEPAVQALAYFGHDKVWARAPQFQGRLWVKSGTYYVMHMAVASLVAYSVTGSWLQALTLSLLEPTVQMVFFFLHEKLWERRAPLATARLAAA